MPVFLKYTLHFSTNYATDNYCQSADLVTSANHTHCFCFTGSDTVTSYSDASDAAPRFLAGEADRLALRRGERDRLRERLAERLFDLQQT